ncbi:MAG: c-type cytochrome, partial [Limisphaerales bacterium]
VIRGLADQRIQIPKVLLRDALSDPDPRVQLQAVLAIERLGLRSLAGDIIRAAGKPYEDGLKLTGQQDYRFPHVAVQVLGRLQAVDECLAGVSDPRTRGVSLTALKLMHRMDAVSGLVKLLDGSGTNHSLRMQLIETLARLGLREAKWDEDSWWTTRPDDRGPYYEPESWEATPMVRAAIERGFAKLPKNLRGPVYEIVAANRLDVGSMDFGDLDPLTVALRSARPNASELRVLSSGALTRKLSEDQRLAAYRAIGRSREPNVLQLQLQVLAGWDEDTSITNLSSRELNGFINSPELIDRVEELQALARTESHAVSEVAWKALLSLSRNPLVPEAKRAAGLKIALNNPTDVGYYRALRDLKFTGFEGPIEAAMKSDYRRLRVTARGAMAAILNAAKAKTIGKPIAELPLPEVFEAAMKSTGDAALGKELYARQACASCHAVSLSEIQKGPYLGSVGSKFTKDYLIDSILDPGKIVAQGFRTQTITMNDETEYVGFVTRDEGPELDIRNIGGIVTTLKKSNIRTRKDQTVSMMPTGMAANLTVKEFVSLIAYLQSLRSN